VKERVMPAVDEEKLLVSPVQKLVRFFRRSRDGWKAKCQAAKAHVKQLKNGSSALRKSRDRWKELAKQQAEELRQLHREQAEQKRSLGEAAAERTGPLGSAAPIGR
jgi:hypothetical protein